MSLGLKIIFNPSFGTLILHLTCLIWVMEWHFSGKLFKNYRIYTTWKDTFAASEAYL